MPRAGRVGRLRGVPKGIQQGRVRRAHTHLTTRQNVNDSSMMCPSMSSGACTHLTMQSRMEFKEATFYKASSSFHYKGKGSILKPHTCCEYPDSLLEDGTLSAQARLPA